MTAGLQDPITASVDILKLRAYVSAPPSWQDPLLCFDKDLLPPLPEISDATIAEQAFRHRTAVPSAPTHVSRTVGSYEPLESMGDRVLNFEVYRCLEEQRPDATPGLLGDYTASLVGNRTLSYLSLAYGLPGRIVQSAGMDLSLNQKVAADLFEAYIGGVYRDRVSEGVKVWLDSLFSLGTWPALSGLIDAGLARLDKKSVTDERVRDMDCG